MDEKTYLELGETISQLTESVLEGRFGECGRGDVPPTPGSSPTDPFPGQEQANGLPWYWAYLPYLDAPDKQKESALHAGYIKVVSKSDADKVIAKLERQIEFLKVTHDACGNCNKCADGMGKVFDKYIKEQP